MKTFIKITELNNQTKAPKNVCPIEVVDCITNLAVELHELVRLGFGYKDISAMLNGLQTADTNFNNLVIETILKR